MSLEICIGSVICGISVIHEIGFSCFPHYYMDVSTTLVGYRADFFNIILSNIFIYRFVDVINHHHVRGAHKRFTWSLVEKQKQLLHLHTNGFLRRKYNVYIFCL